MSSRKLLFFLGVAAVVSLAICQTWKPLSYDEQLVRIQAEEELGQIDKAILKLPLETQALLLDYARDQELVLKAWIALKKYPAMTNNIYSMYGSEPIFKEILKTYGDAVIPPIQYFLDNDLWTLRAMDSGRKMFDKAVDFMKDLWGQVTGNAPADSKPAVQRRPSGLGPQERGAYAVTFIKQEGHDFVGQFVVDKDKNVKWNQTERFTKALISLFTSGIRNVEKKHDLQEKLTAGDVFWATVDVVPFVVSVKLLRAGKVVAASGKELTLVNRTKLFAPRLVAKSQIFQKLGKYGAVMATAYIAITNPSLINSLLAELAKVLGLNPWLVQFVGWVLIIAVILYPFSWLLKPMARLILASLTWLEKSRKKTPRAIPQGAPKSASSKRMFFCQLEAYCRRCAANRSIRNPSSIGYAAS